MTENYDFSQDLIAPDEDLASMNTLVKDTLSAKDVVAELELRLKEEKEKLRILEEQKLPEAMMAAGFTLGDKIKSNGVEVKLESGIQMSVSGPNAKYREPMIKWLRDSGNDTIIKNQLQIDIPAGQIDSEGLQSVKNFLQDMGFSYTQYENAHTGTVKSLVKSLLEEAEPVPLDEIGARAFTRAKITL